MVKLGKVAIFGAALAASVMSATPALAVDTHGDPELYADLLGYIQAQFAFDGAEFAAFKDLNLPQADLDKLSATFAKLTSEELTLATYLGQPITTA